MPSSRPTLPTPALAAVVCVLTANIVPWLKVLVVVIAVVVQAWKLNEVQRTWIARRSVDGATAAVLRLCAFVRATFESMWLRWRGRDDISQSPMDRDNDRLVPAVNDQRRSHVSPWHRMFTNGRRITAPSRSRIITPNNRDAHTALDEDAYQQEMYCLLGGRAFDSALHGTSEELDRDAYIHAQALVQEDARMLRETLCALDTAIACPMAHAQSSTNGLLHRFLIACGLLPRASSGQDLHFETRRLARRSRAVILRLMARLDEAHVEAQRTALDMLTIAGCEDVVATKSLNVDETISAEQIVPADLDTCSDNMHDFVRVSSHTALRRKSSNTDECTCDFEDNSHLPQTPPATPPRPKSQRDHIVNSYH